MSGAVFSVARRWSTVGFVVAFGLVLTASCSDDDKKRKVPNADSGSEASAGAPDSSVAAAGSPGLMPGAGGNPGVTPDAGGQAEGGVAGQVAQGAGGELEAGGAGGAPATCDAATCAPGVCLQGACVPVTTITTDVNLSTTSLTAGRTCAEATAYSVLTLSGSTATLSTAPNAGCLSAGDELLLINLQGTTAAHANVGNWELLQLSSVAGSTVTFATAVTRFYGSGANNDAGLGVTVTGQRVALIRVPRFGRLVVDTGVTVTANAWDGVLGGVVALRAAQLDLAGTISAAALGYRAARWSEDGNACAANLATEAGESIGGKGTVSTLHNLGASGGLSAGTVSFNADNVVLSTPGHAQAGVVGFNPKGRTIGEVGAAYGSADATQLTLGSGPGGALTCVPAPPQPAPFLLDFVTNQAGGIALILADDVNVRATGAITASPPDAPRDVAFSGGYVYVSGATLALGANRVTALGSFGTVPLGPFAGQQNQASPGYVVLSAASVTGTTNPPAHWLGH